MTGAFTVRGIRAALLAGVAAGSAFALGAGLHGGRVFALALCLAAVAGLGSAWSP